MAPACGQPEVAAPQLRIHFPAPHGERVQVLALAIEAAGRHEADTWEAARPAPLCDVGDGVVHAVPETGDADLETICRLEREAQIHAGHPLRVEQGIGRRGIGANAERAIEFIQRGQPPAAIGGTAQRQPIGGLHRQAGAAGEFMAGTIGKQQARERRVGGDGGFQQAAVLDRPPVDAGRSRGGDHAAFDAGIGEQPGGAGAAAGLALAGGGGIHVGEQLHCLAGQLPRVCPQPQRDAVTNRRCDLQPAAPAGGRRVILGQALGHAGARGVHGGEIGGEIARLHIGQRLPAPAPAPDQPQRAINAFGRVARKTGATLAAVGKSIGRHLRFGFGRDFHNGTQGHAGLFIRRRAVDRATAAFHDGDETVAAAISGRKGGETLVMLQPQCALRVDAVAAAIGDGAIKRSHCVAANRFQFDGASQRARAPIARTTAARDPDAIEPPGGIGRKRHPAAERIGLRHTVQHQQRAAGRIAA